MIISNVYEIDIRSRKTGNTVETIFSGSHDDACDVLNNWYKQHPELNIETCLEDYVDGSDGFFADIYVTSEPHGVGKW